MPIHSKKLVSNNFCDRFSHPKNVQNVSDYTLIYIQLNADGGAYNLVYVSNVWKTLSVIGQIL